VADPRMDASVRSKSGSGAKRRHDLDEEPHLLQQEIRFCILEKADVTKAQDEMLEPLSAT
jgi:hypothetical protein